MAELLEGVLGPPRDWHRADWSACEGLSDTDLSAAKDEDRARMVELARRRLFEGGIDAGRSTSELAWVASALDPSVTTTTCFARRMATHKRGPAAGAARPARALLADARHRCTCPRARPTPPTARERGDDPCLWRSPRSPRTGAASCSSPTTTWPSHGRWSRDATSG
ncbi:MAG: hypothetical protein R2716_07995 [Microthrixaceae bacterium]